MRVQKRPTDENIRNLMEDVEEGGLEEMESEEMNDPR
jgi:hypothetical protein